MGQISATLVITSSEGRGRAKKIIQPGNREWVTVIQAVQSGGDVIPPYVVVAGKIHLYP
jgi:hypothetical protein